MTPNGSQTILSAFTGLFAAGLAALGMNGRMTRIERGVMFKDTFEEFRKAHDKSIKNIETGQKEQGELLLLIHKDMPKRTEPRE